MRLYNSLSRSIEEFTPLHDNKVGMYACGPTVYDFQHIGNYRKYIGDDVLHRVLKANGYELKHVMNITDVGHLVSDEDTGEDKMEKGARQSGRTVWEVAQFYEEDFWQALDSLNVIRPDVVARATGHIGEQIKLIQKLEEKGYTYKTDQAIYFDISKFPEYTKLSHQKLDEKEAGAREDVVTDSDKKNPQDFALWFFTVGHFADHTMRWPSPWGEGFPGWHIECSAMSMAYLGNTLDIHTGGIEHIPVHHTNEIAQSEAATGEQFVRFWIHHNWLLIDNGKMSKSLKNVYTHKDLKERGFDILAYRYLVLTAHYRDQLNFTWDSLTAAQNALRNLRSEIRAWEQPEEVVVQFWQKFLEAANNDLNLPQALAIMWELVKSDLPTANKAATLLKMDEVLGLGLSDYVAKPVNAPEEVQKLLEKREHARANKDFAASDELRDEIKKHGFEVLDTPDGQKLRELS
jgi:cysteinyl-tRNA synthetase